MEQLMTNEHVWLQVGNPSVMKTPALYPDDTSVCLDWVPVSEHTKIT